MALLSSSIDLMQERYDAIAKHQRITISGAGHMVHQDNPEQLADVVGDFIARSF